MESQRYSKQKKDATKTPGLKSMEHRGRLGQARSRWRMEIDDGLDASEETHQHHSYDSSQEGPLQWQLRLQPGTSSRIQHLDALRSWWGIKQGTVVVCHKGTIASQWHQSYSRQFLFNLILYSLDEPGIMGKIMAQRLVWRMFDKLL